VFTPAAVQAELPHPDAPSIVRAWATQPPPWLEVRPATSAIDDPAWRALDAGEREALALARLLGAELVLMDDRAGVAVAQQQGLTVTGTLGVLDLAGQRGLVDLADAFARLSATSFRYRPEIMDALLAYIARGTTNDGRPRAHHHAVDYIHRAHNWSPEFIEARRQSVSLPHDYTQDLASIQAPVLLIHGCYDRMVPFEVSIAILNHCRLATRAVQQLRALAALREADRVGRAGPRVPARLLRGWHLRARLARRSR
jgi:predicted nucleic acid-binding protein